jgi:hypothetical protein
MNKITKNREVHTDKEREYMATDRCKQQQKKRTKHFVMYVRHNLIVVSVSHPLSNISL